jgi:hypothetical protein
MNYLNLVSSRGKAIIYIGTKYCSDIKISYRVHFQLDSIYGLIKIVSTYYVRILSMGKVTRK